MSLGVHNASSNSMKNSHTVIHATFVITVNHASVVEMCDVILSYLDSVINASGVMLQLCTRAAWLVRVLQKICQPISSWTATYLSFAHVKHNGWMSLPHIHLIRHSDINWIIAATGTVSTAPSYVKVVAGTVEIFETNNEEINILCE